MYVYILLSICHVCRYFQRAKEGSRSGPLQLESQAAINHMVWVLGTKLRSLCKSNTGHNNHFPSPNSCMWWFKCFRIPMNAIWNTLKGMCHQSGEVGVMEPLRAGV